MGHIFVNGKPSTLENIFDAVNPGRPDLWRYVSDADVGRPITDILNEWATQHNTYYYLNGKKTTFRLMIEG